MFPVNTQGYSRFREPFVTRTEEVNHTAAALDESTPFPLVLESSLHPYTQRLATLKHEQHPQSSGVLSAERTRALNVEIRQCLNIYERISVLVDDRMNVEERQQFFGNDREAYHLLQRYTQLFGCYIVMLKLIVQTNVDPTQYVDRMEIHQQHTGLYYTIKAEWDQSFHRLVTGTPFTTTDLPSVLAYLAPMYVLLRQYGSVDIAIYENGMNSFLDQVHEVVRELSSIDAYNVDVIRGVHTFILGCKHANERIDVYKGMFKKLGFDCDQAFDTFQARYQSFKMIPLAQSFIAHRCFYVTYRNRTERMFDRSDQEFYDFDNPLEEHLRSDASIARHYKHSMEFLNQERRFYKQMIVELYHLLRDLYFRYLSQYPQLVHAESLHIHVHSLPAKFQPFTYAKALGLLYQLETFLIKSNNVDEREREQIQQRRRVHTTKKKRMDEDEDEDEEGNSRFKRMRPTYEDPLTRGRKREYEQEHKEQDEEDADEWGELIRSPYKRSRATPAEEEEDEDEDEDLAQMFQYTMRD